MILMSFLVVPKHVVGPAKMKWLLILGQCRSFLHLKMQFSYSLLPDGNELDSKCTAGCWPLPRYKTPPLHAVWVHWMQINSLYKGSFLTLTRTVVRQPSISSLQHCSRTLQSARECACRHSHVANIVFHPAILRCYINKHTFSALSLCKRSDWNEKNLPKMADFRWLNNVLILGEKFPT